jgi:DNA polymerase III delta prime subunit
VFESIIKLERPPNFALAGPPGIGKTAMAKVYCQEKLVKITDDNLLYLNCSGKHDKGIKTIEDIEGFSERLSLDNWIDPDNSGKGKIVWLEDADKMTPAFQEASLVLIEQLNAKSKNPVQFIVTINNFGKLIEPLRSRVRQIRFHRLKDAEIIELCKRISIKERMSIAKSTYNEFFERIAAMANGQARDAINILHSLSGFGFEHILIPDDVIPKIENEIFMAVMDNLIDGDITEAIKTAEFDSAALFLKDFYFFARNNKEIRESGFLNDIIIIIGEGIRNLRFSIHEEIEVSLTLAKIGRLIDSGE